MGGETSAPQTTSDIVNPSVTSSEMAGAYYLEMTIGVLQSGRIGGLINVLYSSDPAVQNALDEARRLPQEAFLDELISRLEKIQQSKGLAALPPISEPAEADSSSSATAQPVTLEDIARQSGPTPDNLQAQNSITSEPEMGGGNPEYMRAKDSISQLTALLASVADEVGDGEIKKFLEESSPETTLASMRGVFNPTNEEFRLLGLDIPEEKKGADRIKAIMEAAKEKNKYPNSIPPLSEIDGVQIINLASIDKDLPKISVQKGRDFKETLLKELDILEPGQTLEDLKRLLSTEEYKKYPKLNSGYVRHDGTMLETAYKN